MSSYVTLIPLTLLLSLPLLRRMSLEPSPPRMQPLLLRRWHSDPRRKGEEAGIQGRRRGRGSGSKDRARKQQMQEMKRNVG